MRSAVLRFFRREAPRFGLDSREVRVEYVLNQGGFVNHSYTVGDGRRRFHLKLSDDEDGRAALRRWYRLGKIVTNRHRAPRVLEWIELPEAAGLLFEHMEGASPPLSRELLAEMLPWQARLRSDSELREALLVGQAPLTAAQAYQRTLHDRFREDLAGLRAHAPDFLSDRTLTWMEEEAVRLGASIDEAECFEEVLDCPVHGDLSLDNLLGGPEGELHVLDWDDLGIGDPVLDLATLTGPSPDHLAPLKMRERVEEGLSPPERERLAWLGRATLLDWIIDPLADWVEAVRAPEHLEEVREQKGRLHRAALELYRTLYGS